MRVLEKKNIDVGEVLITLVTYDNEEIKLQYSIFGKLSIWGLDIDIIHADNIAKKMIDNTNFFEIYDGIFLNKNCVKKILFTKTSHYIEVEKIEESFRAFFKRYAYREWRRTGKINEL